MNRNLRDGWNYLSRLTPAKISNMAKILSSYYYSRLTSKPRHLGMPISLSIEPTTSCNLRCPQCPSGLRAFTRPTGMLQGDLYKRLIDEQSKTLTYLNLYFQGEPYLNKEFLDMVRYASDRKIYTATSTNAHYLDEENSRRTVLSGLDRIIVSIDGIDQESYSKYRVGGNLEKVLTGTRNLVSAKRSLKSSTPHIIWQFIVFRHNENQLEEIKRLAHEYGVDELGIKTAQVYDYENGHDLIPESEEYRRYTAEGDSFAIKNSLLSNCWRMWNSCVITWDGKIVPCCFDKDATHQLGDLKTNTFAEIWHGAQYRNFRATLLKGRDQIEICRNCSEGTKIWAS